jgi:hypothetical protein
MMQIRDLVRTLITRVRQTFHVLSCLALARHVRVLFSFSLVNDALGNSTPMCLACVSEDGQPVPSLRGTRMVGSWPGAAGRVGAVIL